MTDCGTESAVWSCLPLVVTATSPKIQHLSDPTIAEVVDGAFLARGNSRTCGQQPVMCNSLARWLAPKGAVDTIFIA